DLALGAQLPLPLPSGDGGRARGRGGQAVPPRAGEGPVAAPPSREQGGEELAGGAGAPRRGPPHAGAGPAHRVGGRGGPVLLYMPPPGRGDRGALPVPRRQRRPGGGGVSG